MKALEKNKSLDSQKIRMLDETEARYKTMIEELEKELEEKETLHKEEA